MNKLKQLTLNEVIDEIEDFNDLVLEPNAGRVRDDWANLGYPSSLCENNPYRLLYKASESVKVGLMIISFFNGLRYP